MSYITGTIGNTGNVISTGYEGLASLEVQYEGTGAWLDCSVEGNISNKSNTSFTIRVKDGKTVTNMHSMFAGCISLTSLDLSSWDTSNVNNMYAAFNGCNSLTSLDLSSWDTSNVTSIGYMFQNCTSLTSLNVSTWNTSKLKAAHFAFRNCSKLTSLDLSNWNTSKVTDINSIFNSCSSLTSLDLSSFDTSNVTNMKEMFRSCTSLTSLDLSNWNIDLSVLTNYSNMMVNTTSLETINLSFANQDTISVIYNSVPSQAITVKVTPENVAYATNTAPSNVTVIDVISTIRINTTKQQLIYNILYGIQNANIIPHDTEELILYGIMMNQDVDVRLDTIVQILYYNLLKKGV